MRGALTGPSHSLEGIPKGYLLYAVVYHLDGGETAQKFFRREQVTQAAKLGLTFKISPTSQTGVPSECEFQLPDVERIADDDRFWLRGQSSAIDYIQLRRQSSPRKAAAGWHAPLQIGVPVDDKDSDSLDEMLLNTIGAPTARSGPTRGRGGKQKLVARNQQSAPPADMDQPASAGRSTSPSPVWCHGCGMQRPEGDDDPAEVQCEVCKYWSHQSCLPSEVDWNDPDVHFICRRCRERQNVKE